MAETTKEQLDREFDEAVAESAITRGHRVKLTFDGGSMWVELICPESGCKPATQCAFCGADWEDPESERCYDCKAREPSQCWLQTWFDDVPEEYLQGSVEFPVTAEWDCDHPIISIPTQPERSTP